MRARRARFLALLLLIAPSSCLGPAKESQALPPLRFEGTSAFSTARLREVVAAEVGDAATDEWVRSAVDDGAFAIERFYASQGFAFAHVDYEIVHAEKERDRAVYRIDEGPRVMLDSLEFEGVSALDREIIKSFFPEPSHSKSSRVWWIQSELQSDAKDLEDYYYKSGYLDALVLEPQASFDEQSHRARVTIVIHEGVRSNLVKVQIEGAPADASAALQRTADRSLGQPYSPLAAGALRVRLEGVLAESGYADAKATPGEAQRAADGATTLPFVIEPGPRVRIAAIEIRGTKRTRSSTVRELLKLSVGDVYDSEKERESFRSLYQTGLFSTVRVNLAPGEGEERTLVVELTEAGSTEFYLEPGYGSYERLRLGFGMKIKNLFGTGRALEVDGSLAELAQRGRISLITPNVWGTQLRSTISLFSNRREEPSFTSSETGAGWNLTRKLNRELSATLGYEFRSTSVSNVQVVGPPVQQLIDEVEISSIALTPVFDSRDSVFVPTKGTIVKVTGEYADEAIGSQLDFSRVRFTFSTFLPVWATGVSAFSWRGGLIAPTHSSDTIPLQERFFNGGENTVRSFREQELGPTDSAGNPVGGEAYQVFSIETRQKLVGNLDCALFFDTGNVLLDYRDFFDNKGFRSAIGVGLRYVLPIGPIRLDWGINPDPFPSESRSVLHFTVGMAF